MRSVICSARPGPVVVGVDGSRDHLATVDLGAAEAVRRGAPLVLVHVWPGRYVGAFRSRSPVGGEADGRRLLDVAARRAQRVGPQLEVATELVQGSPPIALAERSATGRLLVVGHRDDVPSPSSWGSTATYLAHHTACPLLVRRGAVTERGPVVLAASARDSGTATIAYAFQEAALSGVRLVAVHVRTPPPTRGAVSGAVGAGSVADRREVERELAEALAGWAWSYPDVAVERLVLPDRDAVDVLHRAARRGRRLIAGIGRVGRFAELLYHTPSRASQRSATCPVLLIPHGWRLPGPSRPHVAAAATGPLLTRPTS
jgi:nucleotide-binding universal stress UspA family protein